MQNTYALFSDTHFDSYITVKPLQQALRTYGFRSTNGKAIIAYWLPILSRPGNRPPKETVTLKIEGSGIQDPVLVDIGSGIKKNIAWASRADHTLEGLPLSDAPMAIADRSYFDWLELSEAPSDLNISNAGGKINLTWAVHGGHPDSLLIERRAGSKGAWQQISESPGNSNSFSEEDNAADREPMFYRVRCKNAAGASAWSNVASLEK